MPENIEAQEQESADKIREGLKNQGETEANTGVDENNEDGDTETKPKTEEKPKLTDAEAKLLKEAMKHKAAAKKAADDLKAIQDKLSGIDIEKYQALIAAEEANETAALEKKGEYDRLLAKQKEAAAASIKAEKARADAAEAETKKLMKSIEDLTTGQAFSNSKFVADKLTLTPNKAKALYKSHFEFQDGKMVAFDKPAGEADRTPIVDANGDSVGFEEAIASIINADPDKDYLLKAEQKTGSGSKPSNAKKDTSKQDYGDTTDKIAAGLAAMLKSQTNK
jgi:hypothetical protein